MNGRNHISKSHTTNVQNIIYEWGIEDIDGITLYLCFKSKSQTINVL